MQANYKTTQLQGITDLTVLADIKQGFVPRTFNPVTYVERLRRVLRVLNAVRQASREAALQPSPFADSIGRFRGIHFFRFAVVPPRDPSGSHQLFLNVTFDGAWEPYMRIIWGPLGVLLDLIFCHCNDYPMAFESSFVNYMRWVRDHEIQSSFFYADSEVTVADAQYWKQLDDLVRGDGGLPTFDRSATGLALSAQIRQAIPGSFAVTSSLRVLKAFDSLREFFPSQPDTSYAPTIVHSEVLLRFAQDLLGDLRDWIAQGLFDPGRTFDQLRATFNAERAWLMAPLDKPPSDAGRLTFKPQKVQAGIIEPFPAEVTQGLLVLLRTADAKSAANWLRDANITAHGEAPAHGVYRTVAITYAGMRALGCSADELSRLPQEFIEGMEARAGILGDLRGNHPDQWSRPRRNWPPSADNKLTDRGPPIEMSSVHMLLQLRTALLPEEEDPKGFEPLARLVTEVRNYNFDQAGLEVLFVQPMRLGDRPQGAVAGKDHFGYVDGISQPTLQAPAPQPVYFSDQVKPGELFLGYPNSRGDTPNHLKDPDSLLDDSTFLAVRKLRQYPERFDGMIGKSVDRMRPGANDDERRATMEEVKAMLMGRHTDGSPVVSTRGTGSNDFDFRADGTGVQCPFHSHVRRANPREAHPAKPAPRIARRGMSYGPALTDAPAEPRGIVFMAYNASLAEQFEFIQRWLAAGNSSGQSSAVSDPLLGVPEAGQRRVYRYVDSTGKVQRVDLGEKPMVTVEWGLYAFVPAIELVKNLSAERPMKRLADQDDKLKVTAPEESGTDKNEWQLRLEDENARSATWAMVRARRNGVLNTGEYGVLVGKQASVLDVLRDNGNKFSVCGYGERMKESIGHGYLGMDDVGETAGHAEIAPEVNAIIEKLAADEAFDAAFEDGARYFERQLKAATVLIGRPTAAVDLTEYCRSVLASLCSKWFGLPDEKENLMKRGTRADDDLDGVARCPGHFLTVSRFIFSPHPSEEAIGMPARDRGKRILEAVRGLLAAADRGKELTDLVKKICATPALQTDREQQARTVAGIMLGFPPTVLGNAVSVWLRWIASMELWDLQLSLWKDVPADKSGYVLAEEVLRARFLRTMRAAPVPYVIWRTAREVEPLGTDAGSGGCVVVGLGSAVAEADADPMLMFGGARVGEHKTTHACPGYEWAMGVMLGMTAALLKAGALRRTADPRVLQVSRLPE